MNVHETVSGFREALNKERHRGSRVGFVPTMGALHQGHLSLVDQARQECDVVALSIFVNPLQFAPTEDFDAYPRPLELDVEKAHQAGVTHIFAPTETEMYPIGHSRTTVHVAEAEGVLEDALRPGHFDGVATVVAKLFAIGGPCAAFFGEKDWQQLQVVRRLVADLCLPVDIVGCPVVREPDGLALSSRNVYLDPQERQAALSLSRALKAGREYFANGKRDPDALADLMTSIIEESPLTAQYACAIDDNMRTPEALDANNRLVIAAAVGTKLRLIDNMAIA